MKQNLASGVKKKNPSLKIYFLFLSILFSSHLLSFPAYAFNITGQDAKDLYLKMEGFYESVLPFYSLGRSASRIECVQYYKGLSYEYHQECTLVDYAYSERVITLTDVEFHRSGIEDQKQGAEVVISALKGAAITSDTGNPPTKSLKVSADCVLRSPVYDPADEKPEKFSCEINDL